MLFCWMVVSITVSPISTQTLYAGSASTLPGYNALTQYTAFGDAQTKAAQYRGLKSEIDRHAAHESINFGVLKNQRSSLKQDIDRFNNDYKTNIQRLKAIAQQKKNDLTAALNTLNAINSATKASKDQQLAGIDKVVNDSIAKLDTAATAGDFLPKPITD